MKLFLSALAAGGVLALTAGSSSAMPMNSLTGVAASDLQDVRLVCDRHGRCYQTRPRYRSYSAPRAYYAPAPAYGYGYGGPGYGYGGPGYGYGRPYGGPGIGLNFRF